MNCVFILCTTMDCSSFAWIVCVLSFSKIINDYIKIHFVLLCNEFKMYRRSQRKQVVIYHVHNVAMQTINEEKMILQGTNYHSNSVLYFVKFFKLGRREPSRSSTDSKQHSYIDAIVFWVDGPSSL